MSVKSGLARGGGSPSRLNVRRPSRVYYAWLVRHDTSAVFARQKNSKPTSPTRALGLRSTVSSPCSACYCVPSYLYPSRNSHCTFRGHYFLVELPRRFFLLFSSSSCLINTNVDDVEVPQMPATIAGSLACRGNDVWRDSFR